MILFPKPCLKCKALFKARSEYCDSCRLERKPREQTPRVYSAERKIRKGLLYGGDYRERAKVVRQTATHCHICKQIFTDRTQIQADHLIPGNPQSPLAPAHRRCNAQKGNKYIG
jgi:5-methylcytosine-specific restriction endonuclease McrA